MTVLVGVAESVLDAVFEAELLRVDVAELVSVLLHECDIDEVTVLDAVLLWDDEAE